MSDTEEMTTLDAVRDLRIMAASIIVDHDDYKGRLLRIANWIEHSFAGLLTAKSVTFQQVAWPESEVVKRQDEIIRELQQDLARTRESLAHARMALREWEMNE
jgi:hypothetical protein